MPLFAANLSMMFTEYPFTERFSAAADAGFKAVEYLFPFDYPAQQLADLLQEHQLQQVLFNTPPGDWEGGERGLGGVPGREQEFLDGIQTALEYAAILKCPRIHAMAGLLPTDADRSQHIEVYLKNLQQAAALCSAANTELLIEPINPINLPGYLLNDFNEACDILDTLNEHGANVKLQFDFFHCMRLYGEIPDMLAKCKRHVAHFQIAGTPDRHEPDNGTLPYREAIAAAVENGFGDLAIGCEYIPAGKTEDGLGWLRNFN